MKNCVVYYSKNGSTKIVAEVLAEMKDAKLFELQEVKQRKEGPFSFMKAGVQGITKKRTKLKNYFSQDIKEFDTVYLGTPIWAAYPTPAANSFIDHADFTGKEVVVFILCGDANHNEASIKAIAYLEKILTARGAKDIVMYSLQGLLPGQEGKKADLIYRAKETFK